MNTCECEACSEYAGQREKEEKQLWGADSPDSPLDDRVSRQIESDINAVCEFVKAYEKKKFEIMHNGGSLLSVCGFMLDYCKQLRDCDC